MKVRSLLLYAGLTLSAACVALGIAVYRSGGMSPRGGQQPTSAVLPEGGQDHPEESSAVTSEEEGWVGSQKCAKCHSEIWQKYQKHPMARSAAPVKSAAKIEDYVEQVSFARPGSRTYRVESQGERVIHHEVMTDKSGEIVYDQGVEVQFELGSGKRGRSYVIDRGGILYQSPISWYTSGNRWDLSPGYRPRTHQRFDRRVTGSCLNCHVGRVAGLADCPDRFQTPAVLEYAIGCERCHGPGREHVRYQEQKNSPGAEARDTIVQPLKLDAGAREDVCNQCHLQGHRLLRNGRSDYDFRPGQRLEEIWTIFTRDDKDDDASSLRAVGQVEQMRESVCWQESGGRLGCTSCHDPHSTPDEPARLEFYTQRCLACHETNGCSESQDVRNAPPANGACIQCHMPALAARDVPHTSQTDHRILRRPEMAVSSTDRNPLALFDDAESRLPAYDVNRGRSLHLAERLLKKPNPKMAAELERSLREILSEMPDDVEVLQQLGSLCMILKRPQEAEELWRRVLQLRPEHEGALLRMAILEREQGHLAESLELMQRYARFNPWLAEFHASMAQLLWQSGETEEALSAARRGLELDPRMLPIRMWLARALAQSGQPDAAKEQVRILERMQDR